MTIQKDLETLRFLDNAISKSAEGFTELVKRADDIYDQRVDALAKKHNVSMSVAHGMASSDEICKRSYAVSLELKFRADQARAGASQLAAYHG